MNESALAADAAFSISSSVASEFPTFKLSLIVPENSDGSCGTAATFLLRNSRSRSLMLWPSMEISPEAFSANG